MLVNISRSKFLINNSRDFRKIRERSKIANCNHCGGAFRNNGDMTTCIMCSREQGHSCGNCAANTDVVEKNKKSA